MGAGEERAVFVAAAMTTANLCREDHLHQMLIPEVVPHPVCVLLLYFFFLTRATGPSRSLSLKRSFVLQGYLAHEKPPPPWATVGP